MLEKIRTDLFALHHAASAIEGWRGDQALTFIKVGEYPLALDDIAYAYLDSKQLMPSDLFVTFERLAVAMGLERDEEFEGVARLRVAQTQ